MTKITYIEASGLQHDIDVPVGHTLMEGARDNAIPGILADCSGSCACGTCKVLIGEAWRDRIPAIGEIESATIEMFDEAQPGERLSCQVVVTDDMDGMIVTMPEKQF